jgi:Zn-dependent M28 family amino/carboxypeptidase
VTDDDPALDRALGRAWRDDAPRRLLIRLTELDDRLGGHPGERRAADLVADALDAAGARDVRRRPFEMARWTRRGTDLAVSVPDRGIERAFEAVALPYTPPCDCRGELVDVGYGAPETIADADVAGDVVVASTETPPGFGRYLHRVEKVGAAAEAGAAAFVFANHVPGQLPPTGSLRFGREAAIPGVGVSRETGDWLRKYAAEGATATLRVDATTAPGESRNVTAVLGPDTREELLVVAHYDAHDVGEGALDNACGVATLAGAARILADLDLDFRVRLAGVGCEELGLLGSEALADRLDLDRVRAVVNLDGVGRYRRLRALAHGSAATEAVAERVAERVGHPVEAESRPHPHSDHWPFVREGVPALQLHSRRSERDRRWQRGWTHTRADTRDKTDARTIREHAMLTALLVRELAGAELPRLDPADVRDHLREAGAEAGMRAAGIWPDGWD